MPSDSRRTAVLRRLGAAEADLDALLAYTDNPFDVTGPLVACDEPFVSAWADYQAEAEAACLFAVLQRALVQLRFPVREGMGEHEAYRAATRRGDLSALAPDGRLDGGLRLVAPERLRLELHPTPAGRIPVLTAPVREDFAALVRALTRRNAPAALPETMGALFVSGYNNWDRVARARTAWAADGAPGTWDEAFRALIPQKDRYQDRFILLSEGPYSNVPAAALGLGEAEWLRLSHAIRREHECAHYVCRRAFGAMRSNAHDELIADAYALVRATGAYRPGWHRHFLGLEAGPAEAATRGRLRNYRGDLSDAAFGTLAEVVDAAIDGLAVELGPPGRVWDPAALARLLAGRSLPDWAAAGRLRRAA